MNDGKWRRLLITRAGLTLLLGFMAVLNGNYLLAVYWLATELSIVLPTFEEDW